MRLITLAHLLSVALAATNSAPSTGNDAGHSIDTSSQVSRARNNAAMGALFIGGLQGPGAAGQASRPRTESVAIDSGSNGGITEAQLPATTAGRPSGPSGRRPPRAPRAHAAEQSATTETRTTQSAIEDPDEPQPLETFLAHLTGPDSPVLQANETRTTPSTIEEPEEPAQRQIEQPEFSDGNGVASNDSAAFHSQISDEEQPNASGSPAAQEPAVQAEQPEAEPSGIQDPVNANADLPSQQAALQNDAQLPLQQAPVTVNRSRAYTRVPQRPRSASASNSASSSGVRVASASPTPPAPSPVSAAQPEATQDATSTQAQAVERPVRVATPIDDSASDLGEPDDHADVAHSVAVFLPDAAVPIIVERLGNRDSAGNPIVEEDLDVSDTADIAVPIVEPPSDVSLPDHDADVEEVEVIAANFAGFADTRARLDTGEIPAIPSASTILVPSIVPTSSAQPFTTASPQREVSDAGSSNSTPQPMSVSVEPLTPIPATIPTADHSALPQHQTVRRARTRAASAGTGAPLNPAGARASSQPTPHLSSPETTAGPDVPLVPTPATQSLDVPAAVRSTSSPPPASNAQSGQRTEFIHNTFNVPQRDEVARNVRFRQARESGQVQFRLNGRTGRCTGSSDDSGFSDSLSPSDDDSDDSSQTVTSAPAPIAAAVNPSPKPKEEGFFSRRAGIIAIIIILLLLATILPTLYYFFVYRKGKQICLCI